MREDRRGPWETVRRAWATWGPSRASEAATPGEDSEEIRLVSGLLDATFQVRLAPVTREIEEFHPDLAQMLCANKGIRRWEYGMMLRGLPSLHGRTILDVGAGPSWLPVYVARRLGGRVTVLDLAQPYTIEGRVLLERLREAGVQFQIGDMRAIPFGDAGFDVVVSISAIEHLSHAADHRSFPTHERFLEDTVEALREMYRVLRPGGWLYVTSEAYLPGRVKRDRWAGRLLDGRPYGAYAFDEIGTVFVETLRKLGAAFPYPLHLESERLLRDRRYASYRDRFMTGFNLFARKGGGRHRDV
jgi:SAM-dependent methyltransferase